MSLDHVTLEAVAQKLETQAGNPVYEKAWRAAAKVVRSMKKLTGEPQKLPDKSEQISSSSARAVGSLAPAVNAGGQSD